MITLISPAKTLDLESNFSDVKTSSYPFQTESTRIMKKLKSLNRKKIGDVMSLSENLSDLNFQRFQEWSETPEASNLHPAVFMFKGDVYLGLDAKSLSESELEVAQNNLRILSGLYGYLKPLDQVQPYRLEMGTTLPVGRNKNLYQFWGSKISKAINSELKDHTYPVIVNLASNEYFKAANSKEIKGKIVTPVFKDFKNGKYKVISFFAKNARGVMARWIIQNRIENPEKLIEFNENGYSYNEPMSTALSPVFTRE